MNRQKKTKFIMNAASGIASLSFGIGIIIALFSGFPFLLLTIIAVFGFVSGAVQFFRCKKMFDNEQKLKGVKTPSLSLD